MGGTDRCQRPLLASPGYRRPISGAAGDPACVDGVKDVAGIKDAVADAIKGTPLESSKVYLAGTGSMYSDMQTVSSST
jgi:uncharacterized membrane protein YdfJ with MMPL/SSD domain